MILPAPRLALCALGVLLAACNTLPKEPLLTRPDGKKICAVHRRPLVRVKAWRADPKIVCLLPAEGYFAVAERFPNNLGNARVALQRSEDFTVPSNVSYCPACEEAIARRLR
jgi:hypothetical protein